MQEKKLVRIIAGSKSDLKFVEITEKVLKEYEIGFDRYISSAHRNPEKTNALASQAEKDGIQVIISMAGMAASLPGAIASKSTLPVIGVPLPGSDLNGVDALYSIVQMPSGIPIATMGIGKAGAKNAAFMAMSILALQKPEIKEKLIEYRESWNK